jgi:histidyl-tRNA synthetase
MAKPIFQNVTGMPDILPRDMRFYDMVEKVALKIANYYGYEHVVTPVLEYSDLFQKGTGQSTDVVQKQMYAFEAEGGASLALRPEFTPSLVRAYIQHGMASWPQPVKLCEVGPVFRHERPQSGRLREFRQFELDAFGENDPVLDVQIIFMFFEILKAVGIGDITIQVNSIGCSKCRPNYRKVLREYYRGRERSLCKDCRVRKKVNLLRLLDCKDEKCERLKTGAPEVVDHLCMECHNHLKEVLETLDSLELPYALAPHLVRGLDYYTKTVFEMFALSGAEEQGEKMIALAGGGRFDDLTKLLGGGATPAVGGSLGMERVIARMKKLGIKAPHEKEARIFLVHLGDLAKRKSLKLLEDFRSSGLLVKEALGRPSIRAQMELANKMQIDYALILGHQEVAEDTIIIRDMKSGSQEVIPIARVIKELKKRLK